MSLELRLDNLFLPEHGIDRVHFDELAGDRFPSVHEEIRRQRSEGRLGFYELPDGGDLVDRDD